MIVGLFIISLLLPILGLLRTEFFPADNQDIVYINMTAEPGQRLDITSRQVEALESVLRKEKTDVVSSFTTTIGQKASTE